MVLIPDVCLTPSQKHHDHNYPIPVNVHVSAHNPTAPMELLTSVNVVKFSMRVPQIY